MVGLVPASIDSAVIYFTLSIHVRYGRPERGRPYRAVSGDNKKKEGNV